MIRKVLRVTPVKGLKFSSAPNDNDSILGYAVEKHRTYGRLHRTSHEDATLRE